jgi:hypothetical protein
LAIDLPFNQLGMFGSGDGFWFASSKRNPACRAARITTTAMADMDAHLFNGVDEPFVGWPFRSLPTNS